MRLSRQQGFFLNFAFLLSNDLLHLLYDLFCFSEHLDERLGLG